MRGGFYSSPFTCSFTQLFFCRPNLSDIGQAFGQLPVLTRMNPSGSLIPRVAISPRGARGIRSSHVQRTHALCPQRNRHRPAAPAPPFTGRLPGSRNCSRHRRARCAQLPHHQRNVRAAGHWQTRGTRHLDFILHEPGLSRPQQARRTMACLRPRLDMARRRVRRCRLPWIPLRHIVWRP